ncbi:MAG TPA: cysteine rich repeat-containing protein [Casimicrobiaceae bacterium]|nr:cysteine rich repeat-containing protein [Casimicrobiaceae bacterium]
MKSIQHVIFAALATGALALWSGIAIAQSAQQACEPDIKKFCAGVPQGEGRVAKCLESHRQQVSPACRRGMVQMAKTMKEVAQACEDDMHKYCSNAAPGTAKECLKSNFRSLSRPCKRELFEAKKQM